MKKLFLLFCLLLSVPATAQTIFLNDSSVTVAAPLRGGMNLGTFDPYDSGEMFKNLLRNGNWNFEPTQLHQIFALTSTGTATSFSNTNQYDLLVANDIAGATFSIVESQSGGAELGCSGTVVSNTSGNGQTVASVYTISPTTSQGSAGCSAPFTTGDIVLVYLNQYPTPESCWEMSGGCDIAGAVTNGAKLTTDSVTPYDGQQSLVMDVSASTSATATAQFYFDTNRLNIFALLNGTFTVSGFVRQYSGAVTPLQVSVATPAGSCNGSVAAPTATWAPFSINCAFNETSATTPMDHWIQFVAQGSGGLGALEIDDVAFQKTSGQDSTNPTVFRDETVAALRTLCATGTPGPPCLVRNWTNQNGETMANWTMDPGNAAMTYASSAFSTNGEITPQLQEYLSLVQLVGGLPYLEFPCTATNADANNFIDYMSSTNTQSGFGLVRANQGQTAPWIGPGGVFSTVWVSFCNESWNGASFIGQGLPYRGTAGSQFYYDYANRAKDIYAAMRSNPNFPDNLIKLGFNLELLDNSQLAVPASLQMMAAAGGAPDYAEFAPYTQATVANWQTDAGLWQSALEEPWGNVADPKSPSTFYQNVQLVEGINSCGPSGTAACSVSIYEEANSTLGTCGVGGASPCASPAETPIDQTHEDYITAGAGEGVIAPLQMLLNQQQFGITAQNYFALSEFENSTLSGSQATVAKLWGCTVDMGGSVSNLNQTQYTFRPSCLGLQVANQSIIGPEYSAIFTTGLPTYSWAGDAYNGPTDALSNVPYIFPFCFKAQSGGSARSCVFINTSLTNPYTVTFAAPSGPTGSCVTRQFAPAAIDAMNEAPTPSATNSTAATTFVTTNSNTCPTSLTLPVNSVTALDFTTSATSPTATPAFSLAAGTYINGEVLTITDATTGATLYYTTDGSTPTPSSTVYTAPLAITASQTINAIAIASGDAPSAVESASYTIITPATPTFSPVSATYSAPVTVSISDATAGTTVYYTTDGTTPTSASAVYTAPIVVSSTATLKAVAMASGNLSGAIGTSSYTITSATPLVNFASGFTTTGINLYGATISNGVLHLTDTGAAESHVAWTTTAINDQAFTTDFTFQESQATANGFTFALQDASAGDFAVGGNGSSLGYAGIATSVAIKFDLHNSNGEGSDSTGFYTNGAAPTVPSIDMTGSGVNLHSTDILAAHITYDGTTFTLILTDTVTGASFTASTAINIPSIVGSKKAFVGFTGGTGAQGAIQNILTWTYIPNVTTPAFSPVAGTYINAQTVTITDATTGAAIYYTTDGTTPSSASTHYTSAIPVSTATTLKAIALATGYASSAIRSGAYVINGAAAAPVISPAAGAYGPAQTVTLTDTTAAASIYYTTDGTTPTASSTLYSAPIAVATTETINAIAIASQFANSPVTSAAYTINGAAATPTFSPAAGTYGPVQNVVISDTTTGAIITYTTDGTTPTSSSTVYTQPIVVSSTQTLNAIAIAINYVNSAVGTAAYTINGPAATPVFSPMPGMYGPTQNVSISDTTTGATIYYTTDGSNPTNTSTPYTGPVAVSVTETLSAIAYASNYATSAIASGIYTINGPAATPTFSPLPGPYGPTQTVTISDTTTGAALYYTTDGSRPTSASTPYTGPISITSTEKLCVIAIAPNYVNSSIAVGAYTINGPAATPAFTPSPGAYGGAQTVSITDATPGAVLYYTNDGTPPTSASTLYSGPIAVSSNQTLSAIAIASNYTDSAIQSGAYVINGAAALPTFNPPAGAYGTTQNVTISDGTQGAQIYYTTDGTTPSSASTAYTGPVSVAASETLSAIAIAPNFTNSEVGAAQYTINGPAAMPMFSPAPGAYGDAQNVTLTDATPGATIYYTTDGTMPNTSSTVYSSAIAVLATETINAVATAPTYAISSIVSGPYTIYGSPIGNLEEAVDSATQSSTIPTNDTLFVGGWAADPIDGSPLNNVKVYVDGILAGVPTLGIARPDVAAAFNNPAYANSGFTFTYPVASLTAGTHYVSVVATNGGGVAATLGNTPITVTAVYPPPVGNLDQAADSATGATAIPSNDSLSLTGWVADPTDGSPLTNVTVMIDGVSIGSPTLGISRPDVASYYNNPAYASSGFTLTYPVSQLSAGSHTVTVVAINSHSISTTLNPQTFTVTSAKAPAPIGNLEQAMDASTGSTMVASNDSLLVSGWVADPTDGSPMSNVTVLIDGAAVGAPTLGIARPDVASYFNNPAYANSGFSFRYAASQLSTGTHTVSIVAVNSQSVSTTLGPKTFTVMAPNGNVAPVGSLEQAIDSVTGSSTISQASGKLYVDGWAADYQDNGPAKQVQILIDGTPVGAATLGGSRPDVATYYNNPAWANTGYSLLLPATNLAQGSHTVTATATDSLSLSTTFPPLTITITP